MRNILQCSSISLQGVLFSGFGFTVSPRGRKISRAFQEGSFQCSESRGFRGGDGFDVRLKHITGNPPESSRFRSFAGQTEPPKRLLGRLAAHTGTAWINGQQPLLEISSFPRLDLTLLRLRLFPFCV